jgi:hypothetical protein
MAMLAWTNYTIRPHCFQGGAYFRAFNQAHVDAIRRDAIPPFSCLRRRPTPVHDTFGKLIPDLSNGGTTDLGEIDRN